MPPPTVLPQQRPPASLMLPHEAPTIPPVRNRRGYSLEDSWKIPIKDWAEADPTVGHLVPLKDWKREWYEGPLAKVDGRGMKYHQCRVIALEFQMHLDMHDGDKAAAETSFTAKFPTAQGFTAVLHAVQAARKSRGEIKSRHRHKS